MDVLAEIDWQPLLEGGDGPPLLLFIVIGMVIVAVTGMIQWRRVRIGEAEASLKMRMIERGFSPEQIAQVVQSQPQTQSRSRCRKREFLTSAST